ncbi:hypothetical protein [Endozoicomonas sp. ISHI1]|uniref:hypothetical protein n=1 Tax=Endozoicomonas sp. ISHI1 TaxID=2825882 RepID=UPI002148622C|nr:hypothetical protein [Endozoicomonas sp. ISHI1]
MDSKVSEFFVFANRIAISVLLIAKKFALFLVFTISQSFPSLSQAITLDKRQPFKIVPYTGFMLPVSSIIHNVDNLILILSEPVELRSESRNNGLVDAIQSLPLAKTDSEKIAQCKAGQDTKQGFERVAFYETKQFHAYVTGMIIGVFLLLLFIIF